MNTLHLPTAYLMAGILYLVMPMAVWVVLRRHHMLSSTLWSLGGMAFGLTMILYGLRDTLPDPLTFVLASSLLVLGPLLRIQALRHELDQPVRLAWALGATLVFGLVYQVLHGVLQHENLRFIWTSVCGGAAFIALAWKVRALNQRERSVSAQWIFGVYLVLGAMMVLRTPNLLVGNGEPNAMTDDPFSKVLIAMGVVSSIVGNIGFLGLFIERMNRTAVSHAAAQARQEEAARLGDQIAQLDRRRSVGEIASSLAHELSHPMTNIYLIVDNLVSTQKKRQDTSLDLALQDLNRNAQKAGDILDRIRRFIQTKKTHPEPVELGHALRDVLALIRDLAHNASVQIRLDAPEQGAWVSGDPVQLSQIFLNVVRNAIQATQGQAVKRLDIRVWREADMAYITFTDNGPGLSKEVQSQVGTAFFTTKADGLGVGLSISKSIAQQHQGQLDINNNPGGGAVVVVQLPAIEAPELASA